MPSKLAAKWLPPVLRTFLNRIVGAHIVYHGPYTSWDEARASTSGYDEGAILGRVAKATQKVLQSKAGYEQDGAAFLGTPSASHALAGLLLAAGRDSGRLSVLDFGGGLASHYLRWRPIIDRLPDVHWTVVEQAGFVAEGNKLFHAVPAVSFHETMARLPAQPNVVLASSVLQYLQDPYAVLQQLAELQADIIIIDRTPYGEHEAIVTQHVPARLGKASYPLQVLSRNKIHDLLAMSHELIVEFNSDDQPLQAPSIHAVYHGSVWLRRT